MKKINGFAVTKLTMSGFKCFEENVSFDFGDTTYITASNGQGKSSIADAIAFAFAGTLFFGEKGLDRLHSRGLGYGGYSDDGRNSDDGSGSGEMMVSVDFIDDAGEKHNLTRTRRKDVTNIAFDGLNVRQSHINTAFGDKDVFLSILNPLYFINVLGDNGKGLLEKLLPVVSHEDVLAALPASSREILEKQSLLSPETFIKNRRADLKKLEDTLIGYRSQKELLDHQKGERDVKVKDLRASTDAIVSKIAELSGIRDSGRDVAAEESMLAELRKQRSELLSGAAQNGADKVMQGVLSEIKAVEKSIVKQSAAHYVSSYTAKIAEAETGLKVLYDEHARINKTSADIVVGYKCPACAIIITTDNIDAVKADLRHRLSVLVNDGKAAKGSLAEVKEKDSFAMREFEKQKAAALSSESNKLSALNQQLQELNIARELDSEDYGERLMALEARISELEHRILNGNLSEEQIYHLSELQKSKSEAEAKIEALNTTSADYDYTTLISETQVEIDKLKRLISEAIQYMAKRIELMLDGLKMSNTEIVLTEIVKTTGEIKDCFRFSFDGRDYKCLSLSEKVRAGLDVSVLIQRLSGRQYPIFVDNGESICSFGNVNLSGQVIISRVVNGQGLDVTYRSRDRAKRAA